MRSLAKRFNVKHATVARRAHNEKWSLIVNQQSIDSVAKASQNAQAVATVSSVHVLRFLDRCMRESEAWMEDIQHQRSMKENRNPAAQAQLIASWKNVVSVMRTTLGLDAQDHGRAGGPMALHTLRGNPGGAKVIDQVGIIPTTDPVKPQCFQGFDTQRTDYAQNSPPQDAASQE